MKRRSNRRGMTLMELLIAGLIMSLVGIGIYNMIRASYDSQDRIIDQNTAIARGRQAIDDWVDNIRGAANVTQANNTSITIVNNAGESVRYWKSGTEIRRSVNGIPSTGLVVVRGVSVLDFTYWYWTGTSWSTTKAPTNTPTIGGLHISATMQMGSSTRTIVSDVKIRQRRLSPNP